MNTKKISSKTVSLRLILVIPIIILALAVFSLSASAQKNSSAKKEVAPPPPPPPPPGSDKQAATNMTDGAYQVVDVMPEFPGGEVALLKYITDSTRYPNDAKTSAIQGKVITRFMVRADGTVSDVSVLKGVSPSLDKEAVRVVGTLPKFTPGNLKGKNVPVWFMVPIQFSLK